MARIRIRTPKREVMNALVTGASSGIGKDIAFLLAERGYHVVLVARREEELQEVAAGCKYGATVLPMDLGVPGAAEQLFEAVKSKEFPIEVLINNAGFGRVEEHVAMDLATLESMNHLNITCLASLCRLFGEPMKHQGHGSILNVGSTASYVAIPGMANYAASKAYVASFTRALRFELAKYGVQVSLLNPGPTLTEFGSRAKDSGDFFSGKPGIMSSREVAQAGVDGLFANVEEILPGGLNAAMPLVLRFLPTTLVTRLADFWVRRK